MNTNIIIAVVAVLVIIGGGLYYNYGYPAGEVMMQKGDDMMDEGADMMDKGDAMMKDGGAMMEDGKKMMDTNDGAMMEKTPEGTMMSAGQYIPYSADKVALAATGKVVLFFRASWCPTCRGLDADIKAHLGDIPKDVTILDVDYDNSTALKQKYGVTYQHTLVQVDEKGNQITKWSGSPTLMSFVGNIK